jgi:ribosomal protein S18 acetylase RimI-like enzyme
MNTRNIVPHNPSSYITLNSEESIQEYLLPLFELYKICFPDDHYMTTKLLKGILTLCKNNKSCILVDSSINSKIIGGLFVLEGGKYTENGYGSEANANTYIIFNIFVHPEYQCKGYASLLLTNLFSTLESGQMIQLITREDNVGAQWLYIKHKFKHVKTIKNYYKHVNKDGFLYEYEELRFL